MAARDGSTMERSIEVDLSSSEDEGEPPAPSPVEQPPLRKTTGGKAARRLLKHRDGGCAPGRRHGRSLPGHRRLRRSAATSGRRSS